jgi:thiol-disulfide isomerase/thioredoxin
MTRSHGTWKLPGLRSPVFLFSLYISALPGFSAEVQWVRDYRDGIALARESHHPILVDFWSEWCVPCKQMDGELYNNPGVIEASRKFICIRVDADSNAELVSRFAVKSVPTKVFMDPWGTVLLSVSGSTTAQAFLGMMKEIPETFEPISGSYEDLEQNPGDHEALARIAEFYWKTGYTAQADDFHAKAEKAGRELKHAADHDNALREAALPAVPPGAALETIPSRLSQSLFRAGMEIIAGPTPTPPLPPPPTPIVDLPVAELLHKYPGELLDIDFDAEQNELGSLLQKAGKKVEEFFNNLPNTVSKEHIRRERLRAGGGVGDHVDQDIEYLLILKITPTGLQWKEDRTDNKGKPVRLKRIAGGSFLTSGFALECVVFYPAYQGTLRFRYVGRQSSPPYAHLIAFAQVPERGGVPGVFQMKTNSVRIWGQGLAWVDPKTYQIIRMRTDLLEPQLEAGLTRLTTEMSYAEVQFSAKGASLLLPREVTVTIDFENRFYRNIHRYSDYRLFTVESFEKHEPIVRPHVPE